MLKIKDGIDLKELEKFGYTHKGDNTKYYYFECYEKIKSTLFFTYYININVRNNNIITCYRLLSDSKSIYADKDEVNPKRFIKNLIKADMVERVEEE